MWMITLSFIIFHFSFSPAGAQGLREVYAQAENDYQLGRTEQARELLLENLNNFEGNLLLYSKEFNKRMTQIMHDDMLRSTRISMRAWRRRSLWQKALESLTRLFGPLL